jgi:hypothetical protein
MEPGYSLLEYEKSIEYLPAPRDKCEKTVVDPEFYVYKLDKHEAALYR